LTAFLSAILTLQLVVQIASEGEEDLATGTLAKVFCVIGLAVNQDQLIVPALFDQLGQGVVVQRFSWIVVDAIDPNVCHRRSPLKKISRKIGHNSIIPMYPQTPKRFRWFLRMRLTYSIASVKVIPARR